MPGHLNSIYVRLGAIKANINFLIRCRKCKIVPPGFRSKKQIFTKKSQQVEDQLAQIRIREQLLVNALHAKLFLLELDIKVYPGKDKYARSPQELKKSQDREYFTRRKR